MQVPAGVLKIPSPQGKGEKEKDMIYTVFPKNYDKEDEWCYLPQDFPTYKEAVEYGEELDCDYGIESVEGECV